MLKKSGQGGLIQATIIEGIKMKITKRQLKRIIREFNDSDFQAIIDGIVEKFYTKAGDFETYVPLSIEELTPEEQQLVFEWKPDEFMDPSMMDSSAHLELNPQLQQDVEEWLLTQVHDSAGFGNIREARMLNSKGSFSPMKSRVDPEFAALIKGIVYEVTKDQGDEAPNPFGTGNTPVRDPDAPEDDLIGHT